MICVETIHFPSKIFWIECFEFNSLKAKSRSITNGNFHSNFFRLANWRNLPYRLHLECNYWRKNRLSQLAAHISRWKWWASEAYEINHILVTLVVHFAGEIRCISNKCMWFCLQNVFLIAKIMRYWNVSLWSTIQLGFYGFKFDENMLVSFMLIRSERIRSIEEISKLHASIAPDSL